MNEVYKRPEYQKSIHDAMNEMSILRFMDPVVAYKTIRTAIKKITESDQIKGITSCGSINDCSFCCHDVITMGLVEAKIIKEHILETKIPFNKDRVQKQNSNQKLSWMDKACPMLQPENSEGKRLCGIYEERPLICRTHNSMVDPNLCNKENNPKRNIKHAYSALVDAYNFTSFALDSKTKIPLLTTIHEILKDL